MISELLKYQEKEKEKLKLVFSVEGGKVKRELDESNRQLESAKQDIVKLDSEAKNIAGLIDVVRKNMGEILARVDDIMSKEHDSDNEDELNSAITYISTISNKVDGYESQLNDLNRKINDKANQFEDAKNKLMKLQKNIQVLMPQYEEQRKQIAPKVDEFNKSLKEMEASINPKLIERYKKIRSLDKSGKAVDIAVPLAGERCSGCHFEMPISMIHKIATDGYITCEECGKILFKNQ